MPEMLDMLEHLRYICGRVEMRALRELGNVGYFVKPLMHLKPSPILPPPPAAGAVAVARQGPVGSEAKQLLYWN